MVGHILIRPRKSSRILYYTMLPEMKSITILAHYSEESLNYARGRSLVHSVYLFWNLVFFLTFSRVACFIHEHLTVRSPFREDKYSSRTLAYA
jgi:hypothetical protein